MKSVKFDQPLNSDQISYLADFEIELYKNEIHEDECDIKCNCNRCIHFDENDGCQKEPLKCRLHGGPKFNNSDE